MFKKYTTLLLPVIGMLFLAAQVFAQNHSSNPVDIIIGKPPVSSGGSGGSINASSCPIPGGKITCGSENVPVSGCGHCGIGYGGYTCNYPGIHYAMDIGASPLAPVYMPLVNGKSIKWTFSHQLLNDPLTAIQYYGGTDEETQEQYWIQFHHTKPGSGAGTIHSGDQGAIICEIGCITGSGPHVHLEFAKISDSGEKLWQDAPNYFCSN